MRKAQLGPFEVSVVGLGTNNFGWFIEEPQAVAVVDAALDAGVTFFDTADIYPPVAGRYGDSERMLGKALGARRDGVIVATKFGHDVGAGEEHRGSARYVKAACEASLARLGVDRIDLYQHHTPDPSTPIEETVAGAK